MNRKVSQVITTVIAFAISTASISVWLNQTLGLSLRSFLIDLKSQLYLPHFNSFEMNMVDGFHPLHLFYGYLILTMFIAMILNRSLPLRSKAAWSDLIRYILIIGIVIYAVLQQTAKTETFVTEKRKFSGKTQEERRSLLFGDLNEFIQVSKTAMSGRRCQGNIISDQELGKDPYMTLQRVMAYHLYPEISLRFDNEQPKDCLLLLFKNDPLEHIPEGFDALVVTHNQHAVLAVKRASEP